MSLSEEQNHLNHFYDAAMLAGPDDLTIPDGFMELDPIPLKREETLVDVEEPQKKKKRKKRKLSADDTEEKKDRAPRKARVLYTAIQADSCVDEKTGCFVLKKDPKTGRFNTQEMRTFVVSVRKDNELAEKYIHEGTVGLLLEDGEQLRIPIHGRNAKRTPGLAKARAHTILAKLSRHGVIGGRYVSVLRDFGYGGNSAHALVASYQSAAASGFVNEVAPLKEEEDAMDDTQ